MVQNEVAVSGGSAEMEIANSLTTAEDMDLAGGVRSRPSYRLVASKLVGN